MRFNSILINTVGFLFRVIQVMIIFLSYQFFKHFSCIAGFVRILKNEFDLYHLLFNETFLVDKQIEKYSVVKYGFYPNSMLLRPATSSRRSNRQAGVPQGVILGPILYIIYIRLIYPRTQYHHHHLRGRYGNIVL